MNIENSALSKYPSKKIDKHILTINQAISNNIDLLDSSDRGFISQNIMSQLRNFIEHISLKVFSNGRDIDNTYENITAANNHVKGKGNLKFLSKFHNFLKPVASHYTLDKENSERLMLKYYEYLLKIKGYLKDNYNLDALENINKFPINTDSATKEYYEKIAEKIRINIKFNSQPRDGRFYIQKIKPFFIDYKVFYEVTFTKANGNASKFDRIIAFTKFDILPNYAVKLYIHNDNISILGKKMPIHIIDDWSVSIRPCEISNFSKIFGKSLKIQTKNHEYQDLMKFITKSNLNLVELVELKDDDYQSVRNEITQRVSQVNIFNVLDKCRELINKNAPGSNVTRYLLYKLNNKIIKQQYRADGCGNMLAGLLLQYGCIPFDQMPFNTSLINHNPKVFDLFDCIDPTSREHELFARFIKNNTETKGELFTSRKDIANFENIDVLVNKYNNQLYHKHEHRKLASSNNHIYIKGYKADTSHIINELNKLSASGIQDYSVSVSGWLQQSGYNIDCEDKKDFLQQLFEQSKVCLIYGAAGTGKSTMINHISNFFNDRKKLYLAITNPAIDNLKRKVHAANVEFKTVAKYLASRPCEEGYDILIIDECSTVSNSDMLKVLRKSSFKLLVLIGDVFQIESIQFGNWFDIVRKFIPKTSMFELTKPYRSDNHDLLLLWEKIRNMEDDILEHIAKNNYSKKLDDSIFTHANDDEIILCLNYDGLYGINNINRFLQSNNKNLSITWENLTYKIGDPVLFNDTNRFGSVIYNNLKGKIVHISTTEDKIQFDIQIDKTINSFDIAGCDIELLDRAENNNSIIRFSVDKDSDSDEDDESFTAVVPFQIAYAVSIHKAQGLEYNSVKIVITNEVEEMITHNIFYTAITRAREQLKIYWSPETESKVLKNLKVRNSNKDTHLLRKIFNDSR